MTAYSKEASPLLSELESLLATAKNVEMEFVADTQYRLETRISNLETLNARLTERNRALSEALTKATAEAAALRRKNDLDMASLLNERETEFSKLKREHQAVMRKNEEMIDFLRASFEQSRARIQTLQASVARVSELETRVRELDRKLLRQEELAAIEQQRAGKAMRELEAAQFELESARARLAEARQQSDRVYRELASANARISWFEETLNDPGGPGENTRGKIRFLERRLAETEKKLQAARDEGPKGHGSKESGESEEPRG